MAALLNIDSTSGTKFSPPKKGGENEYGIFTRKLLSPHADVIYIFFGPEVLGKGGLCTSSQFTHI